MLFRARGRIFSTSNATVLNIKQPISVCRISAQRIIYVVPSAVFSRRVRVIGSRRRVRVALSAPTSRRCRISADIYWQGKLVININTTPTDCHTSGAHTP